MSGLVVVWLVTAGGGPANPEIKCLERVNDRGLAQNKENGELSECEG